MLGLLRWKQEFYIVLNTQECLLHSVFFALQLLNFLNKSYVGTVKELTGWPFILYNSETILFILFCVKQKVFCCAKLLLNKVYY